MGKRSIFQDAEVSIKILVGVRTDTTCISAGHDFGVDAGICSVIQIQSHFSAQGTIYLWRPILWTETILKDEGLTLEGATEIRIPAMTNTHQVPTGWKRFASFDGKMR